MPEIGTSGLMSGDGKRGDGQKAQATAPILDSTIGDIHPASRFTRLRSCSMSQTNELAALPPACRRTAQRKMQRHRPVRAILGNCRKMTAGALVVRQKPQRCWGALGLVQWQPIPLVPLPLSMFTKRFARRSESAGQLA